MEKPQGYQHLGCHPVHVTHQISRPFGDFPASHLLTDTSSSHQAGRHRWFPPLFDSLLLLLLVPPEVEFFSCPTPTSDKLFPFLPAQSSCPPLSALQFLPSRSPTPALINTPYGVFVGCQWEGITLGQNNTQISNQIFKVHLHLVGVYTWCILALPFMPSLPQAQGLTISSRPLNFPALRILCILFPSSSIHFPPPSVCLSGPLWIGRVSPPNP